MNYEFELWIWSAGAMSGWLSAISYWLKKCN